MPMKPLTKREKALLYALAIIAVVAGMVMLVILPAQERSDALDDEIFTAQTQLDAMNLLIARTESIQSDIAGYEEKIDAEAKYFLPVMDSDDLDKYITGLLQEHGLVAQSLAISADGAQTDDDMIQTYQVSVVARGQISQFTALIETVKGIDGVRVSALSLKESKQATPIPSATPAPTPAQKRNRRATPTPAPTPEATPMPTPADPEYLMNVSFVVIEYNEAGTIAVEETVPGAAETTATPEMPAA